MRIKHHFAFTMIELIFVIVIMGIIGKFGVEFLAQAYNHFIHSSINNSLQAKSTYAVEFIASRLQNRIKDSVIARNDISALFVSLENASGDSYKVLEWIGVDIEDFRGTTPPKNGIIPPNWSGIIDVDNPNTNASQLVSPATNTTQIDATIRVLSNGKKDINDAALFFIGSNSDTITGYGWAGKITDQNHTLHPIQASPTNQTLFLPALNTGKFTDIYEYYKLVWSAYAIVMKDYNATTKMGNLWFYYNYQPWKGNTLSDDNTSKVLLLENVSTFRFRGVGSIIKVEVCAKSTLLEDYSLCKEKTIF